MSKEFKAHCKTKVRTGTRVRFVRNPDGSVKLVKNEKGNIVPLVEPINPKEKDHE